MNLTNWISSLTLREGKKSSVKVGDVRELVKAICCDLYMDPAILAMAIKYGEKTAKKVVNGSGKAKKS